MNSKTLLMTSLWGSTLALAFIVGKGLSPASDQGQSTASALTDAALTTRKSSSSSNGPAARTASARARLAAAPMVKKGSTVEEMLADIVLFNDPSERGHALLALIDIISPDQFRSVLEAFDELGISRERQGEHQILLSAWAKINPNEALAYASENTQGSFAKNTILRTWATTNPDAALAWAQSQQTNPNAINPLLVGVIEGIASYDIPRATGLMETMPKSKQRDAALNSLIVQLMASDPEEAKNWTASLDDEEIRSKAYSFAATSLALKAPGEAAQWLASTGNFSAFNRSGENIAASWHRDNPEEATAWVASLSPETIGRAAQGVVSNIVSEDPVQAAEYISQLAESNPNISLDGPINELVRGATGSDPELAATWVAGFSNARIQDAFYRRVLTQWSAKDPAAAEQWVQQNEADLPETVTNRFLADSASNTPNQ